MEEQKNLLTSQKDFSTENYSSNKSQTLLVKKIEREANEEFDSAKSETLSYDQFLKLLENMKFLNSGKSNT